MARKNYRNPRDIEQELDEHRMHISSTLDALENRFTPGQLVDTSIGYLREGPAGDYVRNLRTTVGENPVPVTLVGIGLAWLAWSGRTSRYGEVSRTRETASSVGAGAREAVAAGRESVSEYMSRTRQRAGETAAQARARMAATRSRISEAGSGAYERARGMGRGASELVYEHPLLAGLAAAALGALFGAAAPSTRAEDEYLGGPRDAALERMRRTAKEAGERARRGAEAAVEASGEHAGKAPHSAEEAESAAEAVARAAAEAASGEGQREESRPS